MTIDSSDLCSQCSVQTRAVEWRVHVKAFVSEFEKEGRVLRISELFGLKWHDIDSQNNEISVTRSIIFATCCVSSERICGI